MAEGGRVTLDIETLASSLTRTIDSQNLSMPPKCCIFKTPKILFRHNKHAYLPNAFSFGPFHHNNPDLKPTEKIKYKYLQGLLARSPRTKLKECLEAIEEVESDARESYAGPLDLTKDQLVKVLALDGCFIIELFRKDAGLVSKNDDDPIFTMSCMLQFLHHDLILLENQIPWFVLKSLFEITKGDGRKESLDELAIRFFGNIFTYDRPSVERLCQNTKFNGHESKHILDLLRNSLVLPCQELNPGKDESPGWQPIPCATTLKEAGVKFQKVESNSILDIKFQNGVLKIPSLLIQETTETIFRNLISFEQCYRNCPPTITSYAKFLDNLIDTTKDLEILCNNKIIDNWLNPEDATQYFNKIYNDAYLKDFYYHRLCNDVNEYCELWYHKWRAAYMHNYFGKPWAIVSQIFAIIILVLTVLQTLYSVKSYDKPSN